ncbi:hypothetical protein [Lentzea sp. NPDC051838]|uniref:hypothetical protein n=1 Tax=Lentzea sp. NPDC051838 TaxID=3154849 RepID=UPI00342AC275
MELGMGAGFAVAPQTIEDYVKNVVDKAITDMTTTATELQAMTHASMDTLVGQAHMPGSTRFTTTSKEMLGEFFALHQQITAGQQDMLNKIVGFRDKLMQTKDTYLRAEDEVLHSFRRIEGLFGGGHGTA